MLEIGTSGLMSGERKRVAQDFGRIPRLSSTLPVSQAYSIQPRPAVGETNPLCALIAQDHQWVKVPPQEVSVCLCS